MHRGDEHGNKGRPDGSRDVVLERVRRRIGPALHSLGDCGSVNRGHVAQQLVELAAAPLEARVLSQAPDHAQVVAPLAPLGGSALSYCSGDQTSAAGARTFSNRGGITPTIGVADVIQGDLPAEDRRIARRTGGATSRR